MERIRKEASEFKLLLRNVPALVLTLFVISVILMNLLANKSINTGDLNWLALDCGILVSWIIFMTMDVLVKRFGLKAANSISIFAIVINLGVCCVFSIAGAISGMWGASYVDVGSDIINAALNSTISGTWYVLLGSTIAFLFSAFVNNTINSVIGKLSHNSDSFKAFILRSYVSTAIGQFVDNLIFAFIVSYVFFEWSPLQCVTCAAAGAVVELVCEILFSPLGYKISLNWGKEGVGNDYLTYIKNKENK